MEKFEMLKKDIEEIISNSPVITDPAHSKAALRWLLRLKPDADISLKIAALAHDIDRGMLTKEKHLEKEHAEDYTSMKKSHGESSANVIINLLRKHDFNEQIIKKVKHLVIKHEFGGDRDSDILMDADSLAFFETNYANYIDVYGAEKGKKKIEFMYKRMSDKAKGLVTKIKFRDKEVEQLFKKTISEL